MRSSNDSKLWGEINLATAIGLELVRKDVRMILDRLPENKLLVPIEGTNIGLEITLNKERAENSKMPYEGKSHIENQTVIRFIEKSTVKLSGLKKSPSKEGIARTTKEPDNV